MKLCMNVMQLAVNIPLYFLISQQQQQQQHCGQESMWDETLAARNVGSWNSVWEYIF
jgi:hypothetical protein